MPESPSVSRHSSSTAPLNPHHSSTNFLKQELLEFRDVALPSAFSNLCESVPFMLMIAFVGHQSEGKEEEQEMRIDAVSLGLAFFNVTALSFGYGAISGTRTLFAQAIGANKNYLCAIYFQRAFIISAIVFLPCACLQIFADDILKALGQPGKVADLAQNFVVVLIPTYFAWIWYALCVRVLQCLSKAHILLFTSLTLAIAAPTALYLFFEYSDYGYLSSAYACAVFLWVPLFSIIPYMIYKLELGYLFKPRRLSEIFEKQGMIDYLKLSFGGTLQICLEWWVLEAVSILAGLLNRPLVMIGVSYSLLNFESIIVMVWLAISAFNSVRVGLFIGAQDVQSAKKATKIGFSLSFALSCVVSILVLIFRKAISRLYATDYAISSMTSDLMILMAILIPFDSLNSSIGGVMCGLGLQNRSAVAQLVGYYLIGIPFACIMAFVNPFHTPPDFGIYWLWIGVTLAMLSAFSIQTFLLLRFNWTYAVQECNRRLGEDSLQEEETRPLLINDV